MSTCALCARPAADGLHACPRHAADLRQWLAELPQQAALLQEFLVPASSTAQGRLGGTGRAHAPVPVDLRVLTLLGPGRYDAVPGTDDDGTAPIAAVLGAWAGHIAYHHPAVTRDAHGTAQVRPCDQAWPTDGETIASWCAWLTAYLPFTLTLPVVADFHQALEQLIHRVRNLTHATPHHHRQTAPCPQCNAFGLVTIDGHWEISCEICGHHLTPEAYADHAAALLQAHQSADASAAA
ncbi:hypothetical protein OQI_20460 [Streptomyces pharetrae CZA14]|uniref:Uncharacterized protein n=1 Tax=Streptomyces pharetrae CZA14 TaxID=1144883 RepID=A0ABX3YGC3_9ACTN|nr:hypothetical protein OQI_20460 [Streptomyces pharetrae CZA14]